MQNQVTIQDVAAMFSSFLDTLNSSEPEIIKEIMDELADEKQNNIFNEIVNLNIEDIKWKRTFTQQSLTKF